MGVPRLPVAPALALASNVPARPHWRKPTHSGHPPAVQQSCAAILCPPLGSLHLGTWRHLLDRQLLSKVPSPRPQGPQRRGFHQVTHKSALCCLVPARGPPEKAALAVGTRFPGAWQGGRPHGMWGWKQLWLRGQVPSNWPPHGASGFTAHAVASEQSRAEEGPPSPSPWVCICCTCDPRFWMQRRELSAGAWA